jgi:acetyltransferase-like isoleucine patch superfamily enzyme
MIAKYFYIVFQHLIPRYIYFKLINTIHQRWQFGQRISWGMFSTIIFSPKSYINIGNDVIFSNSLYNPTISKKCKLVVANNAILTIGNNAGFSGVSLNCSKKITIGNNLVCGGNVSIWDTDFHPLNSNDRIRNIGIVNTKEIKIGDGVFIGANSIILKGVKIGNRSIVGAGSVVRKDIAEDELWIGNPAMFIKKLNN